MYRVEHSLINLDIANNLAKQSTRRAKWGCELEQNQENHTGQIPFSFKNVKWILKF